MATEINIDEIVNKLRDIFKSELQDDWEQIKDTGEEYLTDTKLRLELYAENLLTGEISPDFFLSMLQEEKNILESEALSLEVIGKVQAKSAITKAFMAIGEWAFRLALGLILK